MRELAEILIEIKKLEPTMNNMFEALKPQYFDSFVIATKQTAEAEADLKTMIHLFNSNWRFGISNQAGNDVNLGRWNKITVVPLASDLEKLRKYLISMANEAVEKLPDSEHDNISLSILLETVFCRVILLNRKRPGELQRMFLATYVNSEGTQKNHEGFSEKILLNTLKRVVIRGKRGRGVPVLSGIDVQKHVQVLIRLRKNFVSDNNPHLFALPSSTTSIYGYKVFQKYARACGAENPNAITWSRLRKHLATSTQLFDRNENKIEQLATSMGHTIGVHENSYRLPDDIYQTAKISKLLILMEDGRGKDFKGRKLNEIELNLEENLLEKEAEVTEDKNLDEKLAELLDAHDEAEYYQNTSSTSKKIEMPNQDSAQKPKKHRVLIKWTEEQKTVVQEFFKNHIKKRKPPKRHECEELIKQNERLLHNKNWLKIKVSYKKDIRIVNDFNFIKT
ncbi:hypothetical protein JTB14_025261 [Gonioctena quinquepunctata]|nr:hypothetical protein JTB14_025261 [Gonioctena quinquepunctata]